jgi:hypothetical protein
VRPERFELPTYCSGGNRSIHLSYGRPKGRISLHGWGQSFKRGNLWHCASCTQLFRCGTAGSRSQSRKTRFARLT